MHPFVEYETYDAVGLAELVRRRETTPSELLEAAIARVEARNGTLNAVVEKLYDRARQTLSRAEPVGPFAGVPFLLKDAVSLEGTHLTVGCSFLRDHIATSTDPIVERLASAGLVALGKTNLCELGLLPLTEPRLHGPTHNPWSLAHSPGGSSGGAAAAVASRMVPLAHAQDGGGSIRIPASACGVFGLKPSRGRNPDFPADAPDGHIVDHCISRTVRDSATLLDHLQGTRPVDRWWTPTPVRSFAVAAREDPAPLRIAFTTSDFAGRPAHADCRDAVHHAAKLCADLGHQVEEAAPRIDGDAYNEAFLVEWAMAAGFFFKTLRRAISARVPPPWRGLAASKVGFGALSRAAMLGTGLAPFEPFTRRLARIDARHTPGDVWLASQTMRQAGVSLRTFLTEYDLLLTPVLGEPPWRTGTFDQRWSDAKVKEALFRYVGYTPIANTEGLPAMSLPLFWNAAGLPIGVQVLAPFAAEERLFALAGQLERAQPFTDRAPPERA